MAVIMLTSLSVNSECKSGKHMSNENGTEFPCDGEKKNPIMQVCVPSAADPRISGHMERTRKQKDILEALEKVSWW